MNDQKSSPFSAQSEEEEARGLPEDSPQAPDTETEYGSASPDPDEDGTEEEDDEEEFRFVTVMEGGAPEDASEGQSSPEDMEARPLKRAGRWWPFRREKNAAPEAQAEHPEDGDAPEEHAGPTADPEEAPLEEEPQEEDGEDGEDGPLLVMPRLGQPIGMRGILALVLTLALVVLAVMAFVFRDKLSGESLRSTFRRDPVPAQSDAYTYEIGSGQVFVPAGSGFAVASSSAVELLDADGATVYKQVVSFETPAAFACPSAALFCDLSGKGCILARMNGDATALEPFGTLISANMNENGWYVLVTEAVGYKALVSVYDSESVLKYEWWSGSGYVLRASVSPDNRLLAVLCAENGGGRLHLFRLDSETELAQAEFDGELPFDLAFMGNDNLCVVSVDALSFLNTEGEEKGRYELGSDYLLDYDLSSPGFAAVCVSAYRAGSGGVVQTFDREGKKLGEAQTSGDLICLSASGKELLVMTSGGLELFSQDMTLLNQSEELMTAKKAILRPDGHVLLLSAYSAERLSY